MIETLEVLNRSYDVQNHGFVSVSENDENQNEEEPVSSEKRAMDEEEDEQASNEVFWHFLLNRPCLSHKRELTKWLQPLEMPQKRLQKVLKKA